MTSLSKICKISDPKYICEILGAIVFLVGLLSIVGWFWHIPILCSLEPGWKTTKPWTAVGLCVAAIHCITRSILRRLQQRDQMLWMVGFSYIWAISLLLWQYCVIVADISDYVFNHKTVHLFGSNSSTDCLPALLVNFALFAYAITGFCTKYSWTVGSAFVILGLECVIGYLLDFLNLASNAKMFELISPKASFCFLLLGLAILVARRTGSHWFISECKDLLSDLK